MDKIIIVILVLIACVALLGAVYFFIYNRLRKFTVRIKEAESEVEETLKKRYELLVKIEKEINSITNLNQNNFEDLNLENMDNYEIDKRLFKIMTTFEKIRDDYPDKLDNENFRNLMVDSTILDEKIVAAKAYYNKYTSSLNSMIKKFPINLIAKIHHIEKGKNFNNKNMKYQENMNFKF